jgi:hypothetical protein
MSTRATGNGECFHPSCFHASRYRVALLRVKVMPAPKDGRLTIARNRWYEE